VNQRSAQPLRIQWIQRTDSAGGVLVRLSDGMSIGTTEENLRDLPTFERMNNLNFTVPAEAISTRPIEGLSLRSWFGGGGGRQALELESDRCEAWARMIDEELEKLGPFMAPARASAGAGSPPPRRRWLSRWF
jgi:hypothetical protein